ncbi:hypothetical protein PIB30_033464 [Stylosanthes scabra]|uniref:Uncharacterized protein n=1 Tax=Stylosanthes scabra TaxID=79078 RepID=A0ABU6VDT7_9FABA|nr:hypothetical protein [Stylosanthes scabra]
MVGIAEDVLVRIGGLTTPANFHVIKPGQKDKGGTPQVLLGRPFLKSGGFKLNYHDEIFTFEAGNAMEIFHFTMHPEPEKGFHQLQYDRKKKPPRKKRKAEGKKRKKDAVNHGKEKGISMEKEPDFRKRFNMKKLEGRKKKKSRKKKRKGKAEAETDKARIKCSSLSKLFGKLKGLKRLLHQKKEANNHLVRNNSKWK